MEYSVAIPSVFILPSLTGGAWLQAFSTVPLVPLAFAVSLVLMSLVLRRRNASHLETLGRHGAGGHRWLFGHRASAHAAAR